MIGQWLPQQCDSVEQVAAFGLPTIIVLVNSRLRNYRKNISQTTLKLQHRKSVDQQHLLKKLIDKKKNSNHLS